MELHQESQPGIRHGKMQDHSVPRHDILLALLSIPLSEPWIPLLTADACDNVGLMPYSSFARG